MHLFLVNNLIDNASLSMISGTELYQFPLTNIQHEFTTKIFRVEANACSILIDTALTTPKDTIMIVGSSVDGIGFTTANLYSSTTTDFTGAVAVPIDVSSEYNIAWVQFTSTNHRYFKLEFTGTGSVTEVSNIFLGQADTLNSKGMSARSFKYNYADKAEINSNRYGNRFSTNYSKLLSMSGSFSVLEENDRQSLEEIVLLKGMTKPFFIILDKDNFLGTDSKYKFSGYFYFSSLPEFSSLSTKYFTSNFALEQAGRVHYKLSLLFQMLQLVRSLKLNLRLIFILLEFTCIRLICLPREQSRLS
jgi:hypothetical protein